MSLAARKIAPAADKQWKPAPELDAAYRASISVHYPNSDPLTLSIRVDLMALRDRASAALNRCCAEAEPSLSEAVRLASVSALSGASTRSLAFTRVAVDSLIFAATMLQRADAPVRAVA